MDLMNVVFVTGTIQIAQTALESGTEERGKTTAVYVGEHAIPHLVDKTALVSTAGTSPTGAIRLIDAESATEMGAHAGISRAVMAFSIVKRNWISAMCAGEVTCVLIALEFPTALPNTTSAGSVAAMISVLIVPEFHLAMHSQTCAVYAKVMEPVARTALVL
jgi:hypothetical protein